MHEDTIVSPEVQRRVNRGWEWYLSHIPRRYQENVDPEKLSMVTQTMDILGQTFQGDSGTVLNNLGISRERAAEMGMWRPDDNDEADYYDQLDAAWYRKLTDTEDQVTRLLWTIDKLLGA